MENDNYDKIFILSNKLMYTEIGRSKKWLLRLVRIKHMLKPLKLM